MNIQDLYEKIKEADYQISTDTRSITKGAVFFAWKGADHDANDFVQDALEKGASCVVMDNPSKVPENNDSCILVEDSIRVLQDIAHYHRKQFDIPVVGLTGSNGKTTTKELIASVLGTEKKIIFTQGNLNNHVGVPKTLLQIRPDTEIAIVEMGANHVGEIAELCRIAHPTHGLITNIGRAHIGLFGGYENIIRGKTELYRYLEYAGGVSFVNGNDTLLLGESNTDQKVIYLSQDSSYSIKSHETIPFVSFNWNDSLIETQLTGEYNIPNIAAAIAIGSYFGLDEGNIKKGVSGYKPQNQRSEIIETRKGNTIIKDYYNANRSSVELALENFSKIKLEDKERFIFLGDMLELGEYEQEDHRAIVEQALSMDIDALFLVGPAFSQLNISEEHVHSFENVEALIERLQKIDIQNTLALLKASQGMNFNKLFEEIFKDK